MADYKLISADSHVNEVSADRVRRRYGDRAPEIVWNPSEHEHGPYLSIRDWETSLEGKNRESCAMEFVGIGPWEPNARLRDMDRDGVEVDILYESHLRHIYGLSITDVTGYAVSYNRRTQPENGTLLTSWTKSCY